MPTMPMHAKTTMVLALAALALAPLLPGATAKTFEVPIYLHDNPLHAAPEVVNAGVGDQVVLTVVNQGSSPHNLVVCGDGAGSSGTCQDAWASTPMLQPNQEVRLNFTATKAGTFEYYCDIPGHKPGGMVGRLVVSGEATENGTPLPGLPAALLALAAVALALRRT